jgi:hypothetical protein
MLRPIYSVQRNFTAREIADPDWNAVRSLFPTCRGNFEDTKPGEMVHGAPNVDTANDLSRPLDLGVFLQTQQILGPPALIAARLLDTQRCFQVILSRRAKRHNVIVMLLHSIIQI